MPHPFSNPLRQRSSKDSELYPYYAGFSEAFVADAFGWLKLDGGTVLDPWVGAGTTTRAAKNFQVNSVGFDLNPVMVLVAKAEQLDRADAQVLAPLAKKIVAYSEAIRPRRKNLPLEIFFAEAPAQWISAIALAVWVHLVDEELPTEHSKGLHAVSPLPALFFVGLFNVTRALLAPLNTSNPTWIRTPSQPDQRIHVSRRSIFNAFIEEVNRLAGLAFCRPVVANKDALASIYVADSRALPLEDESVQGVVTSPPYCTRLDYGRATMPELLILESIGLACYEESRLSLMGAAVTRNEEILPVRPDWGETCTFLLEQIYHHSSKASKTYYYRSHYTYFRDIAKSVTEIARVLTKNGKACVVVQDSYYKEIHNDLPKIFTEMAAGAGLEKVGEYVYEKRRSMCRINSGTTPYRASRVPLETVILFHKR